MDKEIVKAMATKFSEIFAISMLKKHRKFCRRGLTHLDATPTFKNRPNTYASPCMYFIFPKFSSFTVNSSINAFLKFTPFGEGFSFPDVKVA